MKTRTNNPALLGALFMALCLLAPLRGAAQNFTNLFNFVGGQGQTGPLSGLVASNNIFYGTTYFGGTNENGTVFAYNGSNATFTTLYNFSFGGADTNGDFTNVDGAGPTSSLVLSGNTLYGTTVGGAPSGFGAVFAIHTDGTGYTNLYVFTNGMDGANPESALILSNNVLYGTANGGGTNGNGTVFSLNTDGSGFANLYTFSAGTNTIGGVFTNADGAFPFAGVTLVGSSLFGTTGGGGLAGSGTVFAVGTTGANFRLIHTFSADPSPLFANADGAVPEASLLLSGSLLYGTTFEGGANGNGTVFTINTGNQAFANIHNLSAGNFTPFGLFTNNDGAGPAAGLAVVGNTLYGTTSAGGASANGTVFALNTNGAGWTILHNFTTNGSSGLGTNLDGASPGSQLLVYNNALYGTTAYGGTNGAGTIFSANEISESFTVNPTNGFVPVPVTFSASGTDNYGDTISKYSWTLGDGSISNSQTPTHTYNFAGTYPTSLTVTNSHGLVIIEPGPTLFLPARATTVAFTAAPTNGLLPLPVSFTSPTVDSSGTAITHWNWTFGDGGTSTLQNPSHTYTTPGSFSPSLVASNIFGGVVNGFGPSEITATNILASLGLVLNGGFESGDFTGWTLSGSPANDINVFVDNGSGSEIPPHSGNYLAAFGSTASLFYLSQTLATTPGSAYNLTFSLNSPDGLGPNEFLVAWNGTTLLDQTALPALGWTNLQFLVTATQTNTVLTFGFRDDPSYLGLDDVSVFPVSFNIAGITVSGTNIALTGSNGISGGAYVVLSTTNLALPLNQWTPLTTNVLSAGGNFSIPVTNGVIPGAAQQFFILQLQ